MDIPIKDWTFTHWWVRPVVKVWFHLYHKTVTYSGTEHIDWSKSIIFAPSHQSAFTDALCLILPTRYTNDRFIYPLIRADAFGTNGIIDWILTAFHMLPVYRPEDNVDIKERNDSVFSDCYEILSKNRNLLIHPEGNCYAVKKVRRFKKGLARIALGAEETYDFELGVTVIPVGINYRRLKKERGGIHIRFGNPVAVSDFADAYREHPASAIVDLTNRIEQEVKQVTVDIQDDQYYELIEEVMEMFKSRHPDFSGATGYKKEEVFFEKRIIEKTERALGVSDRSDKVEYLVQKIRQFKKRHKLEPKLPLIQKYTPFRLVTEGLGYLVMAPLFVYGWMNNIIPWFLMQKSASKIEDAQFINSVRMVSGLFLFPVCYLLQTLIFGFSTGNPVWTLIYLVSLPVTGILSLNIWEKWKLWKQQLKLALLSKSEKKELDSKVNALFELLDVNVFKDNYRTRLNRKN